MKNNNVCLRFIKSGEYSKLIAASLNKSIYHEVEWHENISKNLGYRVHYLLISVAGIEYIVIPLFEKQIFPIHFIGSPLSGSHTEFLGFMKINELQNEIDIGLIAQEFVKVIRKKFGSIYFELTQNPFNNDPNINLLTIEIAKIFKQDKIVGASALIDLTIGYEKIYAEYAGRVRTDIRKAQRSGVEVFMLSGEEALFSVDQFFTIMTNAFIRRGLKPRHPKNFFHGLIAINKVSPVLFYAKLNSIVISTALTVIDGGRRIYLSGGSTTDGLKYCASSAIQDAIIKDSISFGCERYDIGGYGNEGIDKFKKGFSGKKYEKARYVYESIIIKHLKNIYLKLKGVN